MSFWLQTMMSVIRINYNSKLNQKRKRVNGELNLKLKFSNAEYNRAKKFLFGSHKGNFIQLCLNQLRFF